MKQFRRPGIGSTATSFGVVLLIVVGAIGLFSVTHTGPKSGTDLGPTSAIAARSDGLQLTVTSNATEITVGQTLNVSLSIVNTLSRVNAVEPSNDWLIHGVPVALWPPCYFGLPAEAAVLQGSYDLQGIGSAANVTFSYMCMEGVNVDHVTFQPNSDQVTLTGLYDVTDENESLGPFHLSLSFTTGGYWNLQNLSTELNIPILGEQYPPRPPAYVPFTPGEYTVAIADEWGQVALLHFTVQPLFSTTTYHGVTFASPWHYVGNVTLSGQLSACEALRLPCPSNPASLAEVFTNGTSVIYAEGVTVCEAGQPLSCVTSTVLVSNGSVSCITPKVPWEPGCAPSIN